jgi:SAM-dependent methyltransferase
MKRQILGLVRASGLLRLADRLMLLRSKLASRGRNRAFAQAHPELVMPPDDLSFDAYNHVDHAAYVEIGRRHAEVYARVIADSFAGGPLAILEWGCGPGRLIRHMRDCLAAFEVTLTGTDYNARSVAWCSQHIPGVSFAVNDFNPPLPFADATFDVTYNFSVFTHLSASSQLAWARELHRVLKPGGLLVCSTHGDYYRTRLARNREAASYDKGRVIVQERYDEGKKWYLALHPPSYVRQTLLSVFTDVRAVAVPAQAGLAQDLWSARKPQ